MSTKGSNQKHANFFQLSLSMEFGSRGILNAKSLRLLQHTVFWLCVLIALTLIYGVDMPSYWLSCGIMLMFIPLHMLYFYITAYVILPRFLYTRKYFIFFVSLGICAVIATLGFRIIEIVIADPIIYKAIRKENPTFIWPKLDGTFERQITHSGYLTNAMEQTNFVAWIAFAVKFFKMWYNKQQASLEAELNILKGQLHPHFLFNTLNNLYALTLTQSPRSPSVVMGLSEILRYMLYEANSDTVTLKRDIEILESYIALEKIRYEERLDLNFSINGVTDEQHIVPLLILPLVENAFKHGTSEKIGQAWINIDLKVKNDTLKFKIANSKAEPSANQYQNSNHGNIGLANVRKRLGILYPTSHQLRILDEEDVFAVILEINLDKRLKIGSL
jgi:hypothetical protein